MCGLFGMIDYKGTLNCWEKKRIIQTLANASEIRGQDATGISYFLQEHLHIYKRALPAHKVRLSVPVNATMVMGHTRLTTQGTYLDSRNNHPFYGKYGHNEFALAHNGVLYNDKELRKIEHLPDTIVETDSYVAVQLLEKEGAVNLFSLSNMAEKVRGSFTFTVLNRDGLYIVKGDSPFCLLHFEAGFYLYSSTEEIMKSALTKLKLRKSKSEPIKIETGDILHIQMNGQIEVGKFACNDCFTDWVWLSSENHTICCDDGLYQYAGNFGITAEEIDELMCIYGLDENDIEQLLYDPWTLRSMLDEIRYDSLLY